MFVVVFFSCFPPQTEASKLDTEDGQEDTALKLDLLIALLCF